MLVSCIKRIIISMKGSYVDIGIRMLKSIIFIFLVFMSTFVSSQDLLEERVRKISSKKKSVFLDKGIFHNGRPNVKKSSLRAIRHSYSKTKGYERVVLDFTSSKVPRIYGYISGKDKRLYVDVFGTSISKNISSFGSSHYVKRINFFPISNDSLSLELNFKDKVSMDIFYLENPGRIVVDIKKI
jgi:hypothetical protein